MYKIRGPPFFYRSQRTSASIEMRPSTSPDYVGTDESNDRYERTKGKTNVRLKIKTLL